MKKTNNIDRIVKIIKDVKKPSKKETKLKVKKVSLKEFREFNKSLDQDLISTNYKPKKKKIITTKVLLDGFAYLTTCAVFAFIITIIIIGWMG